MIGIDRLAGLFGQLKLDRPAGLLLPDGGTIQRKALWGDIFDPDADHVTTTQLAVDCQVEQGQVPGASSKLQVGAYRPDVFGL